MIADLKPYAEYKESGLPWLGQVPGHWEVRKLKQVSQRFWSGGTPQSGNDKYYCDAPSGYPWLMISDLTNQRRVRRTRKHITEEGLASRNLEILPTGTVLFSMYASLGTAAVLEIDAAVNQAIIGITPRHTVISGDFTLYSLEQLKTSLPALASSSTQSNLNAEKVKSLQISLPPPDEQAAIVRFLDWASGRLERAIRAKRKVIALLNEQKQAIIHRAVTRGLDPSVPLKPSGIPWLGDIPQHWEVVPSKALFKHRREKARDGDELLTASQSHGIISRESFMAREGRRVMHVFIGSDILKHVEPNDFVMSMRSFEGGLEWSHIGGSVSSAYVTLIPTHAVHCAYFAYALKSRHYISDLRRTSDLVRDGQALRYANFGQVALPLIPLSEQAAISKHLDTTVSGLNSTTSRLEREIELLREYRTRLVADVVTGKLDVREAAARLPDEAPLDTTEDDADLGDETEAADEEALVE